jgi:hypothetical protein
MTTHPRYRCRYCGDLLPAWLPVARKPEGSMLLYHLSHHHPDQVGPYLARIHTDEDHDRVVLEAYELVEGDG